MTLTEFRATGEDIAELSTIFDFANQEVTGPGRIYCNGGLFIEGVPLAYTVTIGNSSESGKLEDLERSLYDFGVAEGYIDAPTTREELLDALAQLSAYVGGHDSSARVASDLLARISELLARISEEAQS